MLTDSSLMYYVTCCVMSMLLLWCVCILVWTDRAGICDMACCVMSTIVTRHVIIVGYVTKGRFPLIPGLWR